MLLSIIASAVVVLTLLRSGHGSHYKLNRYYDNIYAQGTPSSTVIMKSGECYTFPEWFGEAAFNGGWKVTCYDTIQQDSHGTYQVTGVFQAQFADNDGPLSYTCSAPTATNSYSVYMPSAIYGTSPTMYAVYYYDSATHSIVEEFGSASFDCFEAVLPPEPSECPFSNDVSRRRLDSSVDKYHAASFNVSVDVVLEAGVVPEVWIHSSFSASNFSNPWKALDNDMIPFLNNQGTSVDDGRRLSSKCMTWGSACYPAGVTAAEGGAAFESGGSLFPVTGALSAYGVSFTLDCVEGMLGCASHAVLSANSQLTNSVLTEPTTFTLTFDYQVSTTLDSATARAVFLNAIELKLASNILDSFPTFALALTRNGTVPSNLSIQNASVPHYTSNSNHTTTISTANIIVIACVGGVVLLLAAWVCLRKHFCPPVSAAVGPADAKINSSNADQNVYV